MYKSLFTFNKKKMFSEGLSNLLDREAINISIHLHICDIKHKYFIICFPNLISPMFRILVV